MSRRKVFSLTVVLVIFMVFFCTPCFSQNTTYISIGTNPTGSLFSVIGAGLSDVIQKHTDLKVRVKPLAGPSAWLPMIETGEITLGVMNARDAEIAHGGKLVYKKQTDGKGFGFLRMTMIGLKSQYGPLVRADAKIKTFSDFKGKKIAHGYPSHFMCADTLNAALANLNVSLKDMKKVRVSTYTAGINALKEKRVDICLGSVGSGAIKEANASIGGEGCYFFPADTSAEGVRRLKEYSKSYYISNVVADYTGIEKGQPLETLDVYIVSGSNISDDIIYKVTKAIYDNCRELDRISPKFRSWTQQRMYSPEGSIPYHPGSLKLYRELGKAK